LYALFVTLSSFSLLYWSESFLVWPSFRWPLEAFGFELPLMMLWGACLVLSITWFIILTYHLHQSWWKKYAIREWIGFILLNAFVIAFICIRKIQYPFLGSSGSDNTAFFEGGFLLLFMFLLIWATDVGAYFTGKRFGKTLLTVISPNKTWEGVAGGLLLCCIVAWIGKITLSLTIHNEWIYWGVILFLGVASIFGDLFESILKRAAQVKDSGSILPGHGGLLDRLDSTLVVAPLYYLTFSYFEWFHA
jgi:phosphatidate cytidylyltransferase